MDARLVARKIMGLRIAICAQIKIKGGGIIMSTRPLVLALATVASASLGGCGGGTPATPNSPLENGEATAMARHEKSWMLPKATNATNLLYVSNATNVTVYTYGKGSNMELVGTLAAFRSPKGMCADKAGNIWIADFEARTVYEYTHGGTTPIKKFQQHTGFPYSCAIDPATNDLAVVWQHPRAQTDVHSNIYVYTNERGPAKIYGGSSEFRSAYFLAYDAAHRLYVDASPCGVSSCFSSFGPVGLFVLTPGSSLFEQLSIVGATLHEPSGIVWVKPSLLMADRDFEGSGQTGAYKLLPTTSKATVVSTLALPGTEQGYGITVRAGLVIVPDNSTDTVRTYNISNDSLVSSLTDGLDSPFAAIISQK
jgi:hypothetical protein